MIGKIFQKITISFMRRGLIKILAPIIVFVTLVGGLLWHKYNYNFLHCLQQMITELEQAEKRECPVNAKLLKLSTALDWVKREFIKTPARKMLAHKAQYSWNNLLFMPTYKIFASVAQKEKLDAKQILVQKILVQVDAIYDEFEQPQDPFFDGDVCGLAQNWKTNMHGVVTPKAIALPQAIFLPSRKPEQLDGARLRPKLNEPAQQTVTKEIKFNDNNRQSTSQNSNKESSEDLSKDHSNDLWTGWDDDVTDAMNALFDPTYYQNNDQGDYLDQESSRSPNKATRARKIGSDSNDEKTPHAGIRNRSNNRNDGSLPDADIQNGSIRELDDLFGSFDGGDMPSGWQISATERAQLVTLLREDVARTKDALDRASQNVKQQNEQNALQAMIVP